MCRLPSFSIALHFGPLDASPMRHVLSHGLMGLRDLLSFFLSFLDVIKRIFPVTTSNQGDRCFQSGICGFKVIPIRQLNPRESKGGRKPLRLQISELRNGDLFFFYKSRASKQQSLSIVSSSTNSLPPNPRIEIQEIDDAMVT